MKKTITPCILLTVSFLLISCSSDNEIPNPENLYNRLQDENLPMVPAPDSGAVELPGFPESIKSYRNGRLYYWAKYYYRSDGNLMNVHYSHPQSSYEIFTDTYYYNNEGKMIKLEGQDVYTFYWNDQRIVEADKYNGMWSGRSKIFYDYNTEGQIIQKTENNIDFSDREKTLYSYSEGGNLKSIEQFGDYSQSGVFEKYLVTVFDGYKGDKNLFLEILIIPGHLLQNQFPSSKDVKDFTESGYDTYETYTYIYDSEGRVIEKISGSNKVVYQYY